MATMIPMGTAPVMRMPQRYEMGELRRWVWFIATLTSWLAFGGFFSGAFLVTNWLYFIPAAVWFILFFLLIVFSQTPVAPQKEK